MCLEWHPGSGTAAGVCKQPMCRWVHLPEKESGRGLRNESGISAHLRLQHSLSRGTHIPPPDIHVAESAADEPTTNVPAVAPPSEGRRLSTTNAPTEDWQAASLYSATNLKVYGVTCEADADCLSGSACS